MQQIWTGLLVLALMAAGGAAKAQPGDFLWVPPGTRWLYGCGDLFQKEYSTGERLPFNPMEADWKTWEEDGVCTYIDSTAFCDGRWMQRVVAARRFAGLNPEARALWVSWDGTRLLAYHRDTAFVLVDFSWQAGQTVRYPTWRRPPEAFSDDAGWRRWVQTNGVQQLHVDTVYIRWVLGRERRCIRWSDRAGAGIRPDQSWGPEVIEGLGSLYLLWPNAASDHYIDIPPSDYPLVYFQEGNTFWPPDSLRGLPVLVEAPDSAAPINAHTYCTHPSWVLRKDRARPLFDLRLWPNPSTGRVAVEFAGWGHLEAYDAQGRQVLRHEGSAPLDLDVSGWARGLYTLRLRTAAGQQAQGKLMLHTN